MNVFMVTEPVEPLLFCGSGAEIIWNYLVLSGNRAGAKRRRKNKTGAEIKKFRLRNTTCVIQKCDVQFQRYRYRNQLLFRFE